MDLLAILGRGIRRLGGDGPWVPTDGLEMHDGGFKPRAMRLPADDDNQNCFIGGAGLNVYAGAVLCVREKPKTVVCGYGGQSPYLTAVDDAPSDSEVLSEQLKKLLPEKLNIEIVVWPRGRQALSGKTNTDQELQNIFEFAVERGFTEIGVVTVFVHLARTLALAEMHLANPAWKHLRLQMYASEDVLYQHDQDTWGKYLRNLFGSRSFQRTLYFENRGLNALLAGNY